MLLTRGRCPEGVWRVSPDRISPLHNVPVTTTPIPLSTNARSTGNPARPVLSPPPASPAASPSSASRRSPTPSPVLPLTGTIGAEMPTPSSNSSTSSVASSAVSSSTASVLVRATTPRSTPSTRSTSRCSRVWGMTPSSAATTSRKASTPVAPETMFLTNRSWPGTSTRLARLPPGSESSAKPGTMGRPRRCSSSSLSVSVPVIRRTRVVLPWSTCPAVPMVRAIRPSGTSANGALHCGHYRPVVAGQQGPGVEPDPSLVDPPDNRGVGGAESLRQGFGFRPTEADGVGGDLVKRQRPAAAAGDGGDHVHFQANCLSGELRRQVLCGPAHLFLRGAEHLEGWEILGRGAFEVGGKGRLEGGEAELVGAEGAGEGVAAHGAYPVGIPDGDSGLRPAQQLVPGEHGESSPVPDRVPYERLPAPRGPGAA